MLYNVFVLQLNPSVYQLTSNSFYPATVHALKHSFAIVGSFFSQSEKDAKLTQSIFADLVRYFISNYLKQVEHDNNN